MKKTILIIGLVGLVICGINIVREVVENYNRPPYTYEEYLKNKKINEKFNKPQNIISKENI